MKVFAHVARRVGLFAVSLFGITLVTFALLHLAQPVISVENPAAGPTAKLRAARLAERYALDRPLFWNSNPADSRQASSEPLRSPDPALVDAWLAAARVEASGRGDARTREGLLRTETELRPSGRGLVAALLPRLLDESPLVLGMGLDFLRDAAGIPAFGRPQGEPRRPLTPEEIQYDEALRRSVALWWRRHGNEYRERSPLWHATVGKVTQTRYAAWLGDLVRLDFGDSISIRPEAPVSDLLRERLPLTAALMLLATFVLFAAGIPLGLLAAARRGGAFDRISQGVLFVLHATPEFWVATMALVYLASEAHWHVFPVGGILDPAISDAIRSGQTSPLDPRVLADLAHHLVLPVLVLVFPAWVVVARHVRAAAIEALGSRFVTAARARGIPRWRILFVHVLKNCAPPVIALFTSVLPGLVTGSILVEYLFSLEGMGYLSWEAAIQRDFPVGMAILTLVATAMLVAHLLADLLHAAADPRVRRA